jgi:hypothetical protein
MKAIRFIIFAFSAAIIMAGCVKDEIFQGPPMISDVKLNPQSPGQGEPVVVSAIVRDLQGVTDVKLYYKIATGSFTSIAMTKAADIYSATIPAQSAGTLVTYYIEASNVIGKTAFSPSDAPSTAAAFTIGAALIVMNEVQARGTTGDAADWIEIYNGSNAPVNIGGYKIYDGGGQTGSKPKMEFPANTIVPAKGFYVIVVDNSATAFPAGSNFGLSSGGEQIWLENANGFIVDTFSFLSTPDATHSYGRKPDGSNTFVIFSQITRGTSNNSATSLP